MVGTSLWWEGRKVGSRWTFWDFHNCLCFSSFIPDTMVEMDQFVETLARNQDQVVIRHSTQSSATMKEQEDILLMRFCYSRVFLLKLAFPDLWKILEKRKKQELGAGFHITFFFQGKKNNYNVVSWSWIGKLFIDYFSDHIYTILKKRTLEGKTLYCLLLWLMSKKTLLLDLME